MRKKISLIWITLALTAALSACGDGSSKNDGKSAGKNDAQQSDVVKPAAPDQKDSGASAPEDTGPEADAPEDDRSAAQEAFQEALGGSSTLFYNNVRNDVTGKWRLLVFYSSENIADHAVEYYNAYFEADDEVHFAVNLGLNTTSVIKNYSGTLYIDVHEYLDKEEHDANILGGGTLLSSYTVDLSTGEIES